MASIEQTEAGDNKRGLKIIPAQPRSGVCNHAHTAVGHGPAGRRLHITHTATGYYTATVCREATHYPQLSRQCTMLATALQPLYAVWLGWAGHCSFILNIRFCRGTANTSPVSVMRPGRGVTSSNHVITSYLGQHRYNDINHHITLHNSSTPCTL